jgi:phosphomannomutase
MRPLKIGISGIRGIVGDAFTPELVVEFAQAFGTWVTGTSGAAGLKSGPTSTSAGPTSASAGPPSPRVLVCRDTRPSGPMVHAAVVSGLLASGCEVIDLGIAPTPSLQLAVPCLDAAGGISVTAGHNPAAWNALKLVRPDGLHLNEAQAEEVLDIFHQGEYAKATWDRIRPRVATRDPIAHHLDALMRVFGAEAIRAHPLTVVVDCCNGACARLTPAWLRLLGCHVIAINDDTSAPFPHDPEPRLDTAAQASALVRSTHADLGFVLDADGERALIVDETGRALSEELTLALATLIRMRTRPGTVVTNVSTTGAIEQIAARFGGTVVRTPVGQAHISEAIVEHGAVIGGEGNGAVAVPEVHATHDSAATIGLLVEHLATSGRPISALAAELPTLAMVKEKVAMAPNLIHAALGQFREALVGGPKGPPLPDRDLEIDERDGVKVAWPDGWVHVRASNTESLVRIIAEAETETRARQLVEWARARVRA